MEPSALSTTAFEVVVLGVAICAVLALRHPAPVGSGRARWLALRIGAGALLWLGIPGALARMGLLSRFTPRPAPAPRANPPARRALA